MIPKIVICDNIPKIKIPNPPLLLSNNDLWLSYETISSEADGYAIIQFKNVIEYTLTPINDEGLGKHKYAKYGLTFYEAHQIYDADEIYKWQILNPKLWIFCFKDNTVDILAGELNVIEAFCGKEKAIEILISQGFKLF